MDEPKVENRHEELSTPRGCARKASPELDILYFRDNSKIVDMGPTQDPHGLVGTLVLLGLSIYLLSHLEGVPMRVPSIPQTYSDVSPSMLTFSYDIPTTG